MSQFIDLKVDYNEQTQRLYICEKVKITKRFEPDPEVDAHVQHFSKEVNAKMDVQAGYTEVNLDCRFNRLRTSETNIGNWMADLIRSECNTDFGLSNGGSLRANKIYNEGYLTFRFVSTLLPMID